MNTVGEKNPYRYRGYRYDAETGLYYLNSRYYDPEIGRFINADTITDGASKTLGNNLFVYAANNPVNNSDPNGNSIIKTAIKLITLLIVKPVVKGIQQELAKHSGTYTQGFTINGSTGFFSFALQLGLSVDSQGNAALQATFGESVSNGTPGFSAQGYQMITNAPSIDNLNDSGFNIGGSVGVPVCGVPVSAGCDFNIIPDPKNGKIYYGVTEGIGFGTPGWETHGGVSTTTTFDNKRVNVFDEFDKIFIKIMEW